MRHLSLMEASADRYRRLVLRFSALQNSPELSRSRRKHPRSAASSLDSKAEPWEVPEMTFTPEVRIADGKLTVKNRTILTGVPANVVEASASASSPIDGVFIGANFDNSSCRHVVSLGTLRDARFLACFRFKLWWMAQKTGDRGREIPRETQFLMVEIQGTNVSTCYAVFLPLIEGPFRASLQGNAADEIELCLESGDAATEAASFKTPLFVGAGWDPYSTVADAVGAVESSLKSFRRRTEKKLPGIVDWFGWCTWDAFYQDVTPEGVEAGIRSLGAGGAPPRFVIIDDGWQSVAGDAVKTQQPLRLTEIRENSKFRPKDDPTAGIGKVVSLAKEELGVKFVYVWHSIIGYWGGVRPGEKYSASIRYPGGMLERDDPLVVQGVGLVDPGDARRFYGELHGYLATAGVDGVKVDVQCILETLGSGLGGRVDLAGAYHRALDESVAANFPDSGCIACMSHNTDSLYLSEQTAVVRACDDFYPRDTASHTIHVATAAYNSVFLGEFMLPDWDMFQSGHPSAEFHASARAISGGPVYVSDVPGNHNFDVLKKFILPDGSVLRPRLPARPTGDCLFSDPTRDGVSLLKIWSMNKYTGVLGVYNCQGAAWSAAQKRNVFHASAAAVLTVTVMGRDVHLIAEAAVDDSEWNGNCALYSHRGGVLAMVPPDAAIPVSLRVLEHDVFTVAPVRTLAPGLGFAPLGLIDMYNAGAAIQGLRCEGDGGGGGAVVVRMEVRGVGRFGAYSAVRPSRCTLGSEQVLDFAYDGLSGLVTFWLERMPEEQKVHVVEVELRGYTGT